MQINPPLHLSHIIKHFIVLEASAIDKKIHRYIPDGSPGIVFHYGCPFLHNSSTDATRSEQPKSFIYGQITHPLNVFSSGQIGAFIVVLHPYTLDVLLKTESSSLTNKVLPLKNIWGKRGVMLESNILKAPDNNIRIRLIEEYFNSIHISFSSNFPVVKYSIEWLRYHYKYATISNLIQDIPITKRKLERAFSKMVGIPPKQFCATVRIQQLLKALNNSMTDNFTQLSYDFGYYDQAHFIKDFKAKSGFTPKVYSKINNSPVLNLIQLPNDAFLQF
jgi:AraC-like DNA-binding protein